MKHTLASALLLVAILSTEKATGQSSRANAAPDSVRIAELNLYWAALSKSVREGDFKGYKATYHPDAVCVFTTGSRKSSRAIETQLALWKPGFDDTKAGKTRPNVEFRFSQRVGSPTTAHETGMFYFTTRDKDGKILSGDFVHLECLLVKRNGIWLTMMEYQKSGGSQKEWDALK